MERERAIEQEGVALDRAAVEVLLKDASDALSKKILTLNPGSVPPTS